MILGTAMGWIGQSGFADESRPKERGMIWEEFRDPPEFGCELPGLKRPGFWRSDEKSRILKVALCATPQVYVFLEPPVDFSPQFEVSGCYCEYQDRILLLLRNPDKPQGNMWCIPGGKVEKNETPETAVIREVWEETGLLLSSELLRYCLKVYVRFPNRDFVLHLFHATLSEVPKTFEVSPQEHIGYRWVFAEDALKMPMIPGGNDCMRLCFFTTE